ncbi:MAG TPA: nucleoside 2-deoxyribosyltransferase [Alphaproteobacteria bacterium]|nr:nucleoside 2-deoxyribosyltransferase [Alphaproteobacteria bacterium]
MRIYLAGPYGFSEAGKHFYHGVLIPLVVSLGHEAVDPWALTDQTRIAAVAVLPTGAERRTAWRRLNMEIAAENRAAIDRSDAMLAVLDGSDVDSGTAAEIGYGFARAKPILGYRGDFRISADNEGGTVNLQVEYFIRESGGDIVSTLTEIGPALERLAAR